MVLSLKYLPLRLASIIIILVALKLPSVLRERDDRFYTPIIRTEEDLRRLGNACTGNTTVHLSPDTLFRLKQTTPSQQNVPVGTVTLSYTTTRCNNNSDANDNQESSNDKRESSSNHFLLLHGTGLSSTMFTDRVNNYYRDNKKDSDSSTDEDWPTLWELLHEKGYDVTAVDLRGHGLSEITDGPYSIELLAADIAAFVRKIFPDETVHCYGMSAGFGACMAMAVHDENLLETLSGNGFLFDRTNHDVMAYLFSREPIVRLMGLKTLSTIGEIVMKISQEGILGEWMKRTHIDGYVELAKSWLCFDVTWKLPTMVVPTLYLLPEYDEDIGHTKFLAEGELHRMPSTTTREIIEFPGHSHLMLGEQGGAKKVAEALLKFIEKIKRNKDVDQ